MIPMESDPIARHVTAWFRDHLVIERNLSPNTLTSYRDAVKLFIGFVCEKVSRPCTDLTFKDLGAEHVRAFLAWLESERNNSVRSRNQRLAAIRSFFHYLAGKEPQLVELCRAVTSIPVKRGPKAEIDYLEGPELDTIVGRIDSNSEKGLRDVALIMFTYNSGARAQEVADLQDTWLSLSKPPYRVRLLGKGRKWRTCPLWNSTGQVLKRYLAQGQRSAHERHVFLNRYGQPLSRHGIYYIVRSYFELAAPELPRFTDKRVSPHTLRHTTAMHLLQSGVDLSTIKSVLGHASVDTTHQYAQADLEMKARAMERCEITNAGTETQDLPSWKTSPDILSWLQSL